LSKSEVVFYPVSCFKVIGIEEDEKCAKFILREQQEEDGDDE